MQTQQAYESFLGYTTSDNNAHNNHNSNHPLVYDGNDTAPPAAPLSPRHPLTRCANRGIPKPNDFCVVLLRLEPNNEVLEWGLGPGREGEIVHVRTVPDPFGGQVTLSAWERLLNRTLNDGGPGSSHPYQMIKKLQEKVPSSTRVYWTPILSIHGFANKPEADAFNGQSKDNKRKHVKMTVAEVQNMPAGTKRRRVGRKLTYNERKRDPWEQVPGLKEYLYSLTDSRMDENGNPKPLQASVRRLVGNAFLNWSLQHGNNVNPRPTAEIPLQYVWFKREYAPAGEQVPYPPQITHTTGYYGDTKDSNNDNDYDDDDDLDMSFLNEDDGEGQGNNEDDESLATLAERMQRVRQRTRDEPDPRSRYAGFSL